MLNLGLKSFFNSGYTYSSITNQGSEKAMYYICLLFFGYVGQVNRCLKQKL